MSNAIARENLKTELREETRKILVIAISHLLKECGFKFEEIAMELGLHKELELPPDEIFNLSLEAQNREETTSDLHTEIQEILQEIRRKIIDSKGLLSRKTISKISAEIACSITAIIGMVSRRDVESSPLRDEIHELTTLSSIQTVWTQQTNLETSGVIERKRKEKTEKSQRRRLKKRKEAREEQRGISKAKREKSRPKKIPARDGCTSKKNHKD